MKSFVKKYLFIYLFICLFVCLFVCLIVCFSWDPRFAGRETKDSLFVVLFLEYSEDSVGGGSCTLYLVFLFFFKLSSSLFKSVAKVKAILLYPIGCLLSVTYLNYGLRCLNAGLSSAEQLQVVEPIT